MKLQNRQVTYLIFYRDSWSPTFINTYSYNNFKLGLFNLCLHKFGVYHTFTDPHHPWQNQVVPAIGEVDWHPQKYMLCTNTTVHLWRFCYNYYSYLLSLCASDCFYIQVRTGYDVVTKYTIDITEYA